MLTLNYRESRPIYQQICEGYRAQILAAGIDDINDHGHDLGHNDEGHELLKALGIVEGKVEESSRDQKIPEGIGNDEILTEGNQIV